MKEPSRSSDHLYFDWSLLSRRRTELMGFAIVWIMLFHSYHGKVRFFDGMPGLDWLGKFLTYGNMGVEIFVVLSGIGLYYSFSKNPHLKDFYLRRFTRVLIPVWIIWAPFWIWQYGKKGISLQQLLFSLTTVRLYTDGNQNIWFIALMTVCYLLFPLVYRLIYFRDTHRALRTGILIAAVIASIVAVRAFSPVFYRRCEIALTRFPIFILGVYFGSVVKSGRRASRYWLAVFCLATAIGFDVLDHGVLHGMDRRLFYALPSLSVLFLAAAAMEHFPIRPALSALRLLGEISLECYCTHVLFFDLYKQNLFLFSFVPGSWERYLALLAMAVVLARLIRLAETFFLRDGKRSVFSKKGAD